MGYKESGYSGKRSRANSAGPSLNFSAEPLPAIPDPDAAPRVVEPAEPTGSQRRVYEPRAALRRRDLESRPVRPRASRASERAHNAAAHAGPSTSGKGRAAAARPHEDARTRANAGPRTDDSKLRANHARSGPAHRATASEPTRATRSRRQTPPAKQTPSRRRNASPKPRAQAPSSRRPEHTDDAFPWPSRSTSHNASQTATHRRLTRPAGTRRSRAQRARRQIVAQLTAGLVAAALLIVICVHALSGATGSAHDARTATASASPHQTTSAPVTSAPMTTLSPVALQVTGDLKKDTTGTDVPQSGGGHTTVVPGEVPGREGGPVVKYRIEIEDNLPIIPQAIAENIHAILNDPRGWGRSFTRTAGPADVRIVIASPNLVDTLCAPLTTQGRTSCRNGTTVALNANRWVNGAAIWPQMGKTMTDYHIYMVSHEMGHFLGNGHVNCPSPGALAPVMKQQSSDSGNNNGCVPNGWPNPDK